MSFLSGAFWSGSSRRLSVVSGHEDRQLDHASIRTLSETVALSLGACWGPSSLAAAISPTVSRAESSGQRRLRSRLDWVFLSWKIIRVPIRSLGLKIRNDLGCVR